MVDARRELVGWSLDFWAHDTRIVNGVKRFWAGCSTPPTISTTTAYCWRPPLPARRAGVLLASWFLGLFPPVGGAYGFHQAEAVGDTGG